MKLEKNKILNHWIIQRLTAIYLLISLPVLLFGCAQLTQLLSHYTLNCTTFLVLFSYSTFYSFFMFLTFLIVLVHLSEGVISIFHDYLHNEKNKNLCITGIFSLRIILLGLAAIYCFM